MYDHKKVVETLEEINKNDDIHLLLLLLHLMEVDKEMPDNAKIDFTEKLNDIIDAFTDLTNWERTNVLYILSNNAKKAVLNKAKEFEAIARKEDKIKELETVIQNHIDNYYKNKTMTISDGDFDELCKELKKLKPRSSVLPSHKL